MTKKSAPSSKKPSEEVMGPDTREEQVGYHLIEAYHSYLKFLSQHSRSPLLKLSLTQWRTLSLIRFNPDKTQRSLSTLVDIDPSSMTPIIDFFEQKGWVKRHPHPHNRSAHAIRMTTKGLKAYQDIEKGINDAERTMITYLGAKDYTLCRDVLCKLHVKISENQD